MHSLIDLVLADLQDLVMQSGTARASDVLEQSESLAGILPCTHAANFLNDTHGEEHTDEIGMHTVLYSLQRMSRRDARQPRPPWSSLTLRRRTSDERAASGARVSESWRLSALRCRRRGVEMWAPLRWVRAGVRAGLRPRAAPHVWLFRPRNLGQSSGVGTSDPRPSATEGTSSRRRAESLQRAALSG